MASGWQRLGEMLGGGSRRASEDAYTKRLGEMLLLGGRDQQLQQAMMETNARRGIGERLAASGMSPEQAALGEYILQGGMGSDYSSLTQGLGRMQEQGFRQSAVDAPDLQTANRYLMGVANSPQDLTKISGGMAYNPLETPGASPMVTTAVGDSVIGANRALAGQRNAAANLSNVKAAAGGFAPSSGGGGGKRTDPSEASLKRAFEAPSGQFGQVAFDQERYMDFLRWREMNPEILDGNQALAQYQLEAQFGGASSRAPIFVDPSMPGQPRPQAPARPQTKAEYDALPSGTQFVAPDGSMRIKP